LAETPTAVVARRMRTLRQGKFTAEQLAEAMTAQGIPWQRSIVANLENGRRDAVSVDELFALALVLGVTPAALLVDIEAESSQVTPSVDVLPAELLLWVLGDATLPESAPVTVTGPDLADVRSLWRAWDRVRATEDELDLTAMRQFNLRMRARAVTRRGIKLPGVVADYLAELPELPDVEKGEDR
jgi:transcriptional regulator with XRE-family HTH domain